MRFRKANKRVVELSTMEAKLLRTALIHFRNKVLNAGKPTEDIESLLLMLMYQPNNTVNAVEPKKLHGIFYCPKGGAKMYG